MSGGSYEYICFAEPLELFEKISEIQRMSDRLAELGYASDAASETQNLLLTIRQYENRIRTMHNRLSAVWKSIEWWDSADSGEKQVKEALEKYRKGM